MIKPILGYTILILMLPTLIGLLEMDIDGFWYNFFNALKFELVCVAVGGVVLVAVELITT